MSGSGCPAFSTPEENGTILAQAFALSERLIVTGTHVFPCILAYYQQITRPRAWAVEESSETGAVLDQTFYFANAQVPGRSCSSRRWSVTGRAGRAHPRARTPGSCSSTPLIVRVPTLACQATIVVPSPMPHPADGLSPGDLALGGIRGFGARWMTARDCLAHGRRTRVAPARCACGAQSPVPVQASSAAALVCTAHLNFPRVAQMPGPALVTL
jgi:hypothetical protein